MQISNIRSPEIYRKIYPPRVNLSWLGERSSLIISVGYRRHAGLILIDAIISTRNSGDIRSPYVRERILLRSLAEAAAAAAAAMAAISGAPNLLDRIRSRFCRCNCGRLIDLTGSRGIFFSLLPLPSRTRYYILPDTHFGRRNLNRKPPPIPSISGGDIANSYSADVASNAGIMKMDSIKKKRTSSLMKLYT